MVTIKLQPGELEDIFKQIKQSFQKIQGEKFDKRKPIHKTVERELKILFESIPNCRILENPSTRTICTGAITLIKEDYRGRKDEDTEPYTIYFHLYKDGTACLEGEESAGFNYIIKDDMIDDRNIILEKLLTLIKQFIIN